MSLLKASPQIKTENKKTEIVAQRTKIAPCFSLLHSPAANVSKKGHKHEGPMEIAFTLCSLLGMPRYIITAAFLLTDLMCWLQLAGLSCIPPPCCTFSSGKDSKRRAYGTALQLQIFIVQQDPVKEHSVLL